MSSEPTPATDAHASPSDEGEIEVSASTAAEMERIDAACVIDIRQKFELEIKGGVPNALHIPFFETKKAMGVPLTAEEQEILDEDTPSQIDVYAFIRALNHLHIDDRRIFLVLCNSGRRSLHAARLLRSLGYRQTWSIRGGLHDYGQYCGSLQK